MLNKWRIDRRSVLMTWLLSYMAVLLLPVSMSVIVYWQSSNTLGQEIHQANNSLLLQVREMMDNQFESMERLNLELTTNVKVRELLHSNKYERYPAEYMYDLYQVTKDFLNYQTSYSLIDLFYIYIPGKDTLLLPGVYRQSEFAYKLIHESAAFPYAKWKDIVTSKNFRGFITMTRVKEDGSRNKSLAFVSTLPPENNAPVGTNVIMIDQSRILRSLQNMELFNKGHVLILNEMNQTLVSTSEEAITLDPAFEQAMLENNSFLWKKGNQQYEVSFIESSKSKLKYVSLIPSDLFWEKAERVRSLTYMSIAISLLGGILLTSFFVMKNYYPVRRLVHALTGRMEVPRQRSFNEFSFIQEAVDHTLVEMNRIMLERKRQHPILRNNFLQRLLKGKLDGQIPVDESLAAFDIRLRSDDFAVMMIYTSDSERFLERVPGMAEPEGTKLMHFIMKNVLEELVNERHLGYVVEMEEMQACLINLSGEQQGQERLSELLDICKAAQAFLSSKYHIGVTLSVSRIHKGIHEIVNAYQEALDAMEYKLVMGSEEILSYEEIHKITSSEDPDVVYYYPLQLEQQLINFVKLGDFPMARQTLEEVIQRNLSGTVLSVTMARCLILNLASTLIKTLSEIGDSQDALLLQKLHHVEKRIERLTSCETMQEMKDQLIAFVEKVCEYTLARRQQHLQQSKQRVMEERISQIHAFIEEHYKDPNLNISMIGDHFEMKAAYLSKLFKDHTGEGLLETINRTRIAKAKRLITDRNKNVSDVAGCVGFNDVNAFIRTFKKYESITPGKYKELMEKKAAE
ncbi:helix-turn-helix domain-containing protein [Paenibacillus silviterrae]|uniref:helix-turn-helix domain-containing protein n=1 Tax=Paenibacillus silviterrae TaxID=3242194 RepID=UPI0025432406|nr:helix-turn-helix domain-containing protein [Paenibacillus chinjuensis]